MKFKSSLMYAWSDFVGIVLLIYVFDYLIRISGDDFYYSGMNEIVWLVALVIAIITGGYFLIVSINFIEKKIFKLLFLTLNIFSWFLFYAISSYLYVVGLGIDSV